MADLVTVLERAEYSAPNAGAPYIEVDLEDLDLWEGNPRKHFDPDALQELADSIREHGLLEPLVVRPVRQEQGALAQGFGLPPITRYLIIAGERRYRAAKLAGLARVPCVVREADDREALELALIENLVRRDIDPMEEAQGYRALMDLGHKQAEVARRVGRSQPAVANTMRLLKLPEDVRQRISRGELSSAHGIALASYAEFPALASALATAAVKRRLPSSALEKGLDVASGQGFLHELTGPKLLATFTYQTAFDKTECAKGCPHGAYRKAQYGDGYCLRPECYQERQKAALGERQRQVEATVAAAREGGREIPRAQDLGWDRFQFLGHWRPECCRESCPHFGHAQDHRGEVVPICSNPEQFRAEKDVQDRREAAQRRAVAEDWLGRAREHLATPLGACEGAAIVAMHVLRGANRAAVDNFFADAGAEPTEALAAELRKSGYQRDTALMVGELARIAPDALLRAAALCLVRYELDNVASGYGKRSALVDALLSDGEATPEGVAPEPSEPVTYRAAEPGDLQPGLLMASAVHGTLYRLEQYREAEKRWAVTVLHPGKAAGLATMVEQPLAVTVLLNRCRIPSRRPTDAELSAGLQVPWHVGEPEPEPTPEPEGPAATDPTDPTDRPGCAECGRPSTVGPDADGYHYCERCLKSNR